ncbi:MAG TPA: HEAT repeat domain-containing protein [Polyangia bacterium]|nr:HEAT repeat domain-containing protein [Polyangia bacterium]
MSLSLDEARLGLRSDEEEIRRGAVARVQAPSTSEEAAEVLDFLVQAMGDPSWRVRKEAAARAAAFGDPELAAGVLAAALAEPENVGRRNAVVEALVGLGAQAVPALLDALAKRPEHRKLLADALGLIGDLRAGPALAPLVDDEDANVRVAAAEALGHVGGSAARAALQHALGRGELLLSQAALEGLNRLGAALPIGVIEPLLGTPTLRAPALEALGRTGALAVLGIVGVALEDPARSTRDAAIRALAELYRRLDPVGREAVSAEVASHQAALPALTGALLEATLGTQRDAALLLGLFKRPEAARPLVLALGDRDVREAAMQALTMIGAPAAETLAACAPSLESELRADAYALLPRLGPAASDPRVQALLAEALDDESAEAAGAAAVALGEVGDREALAPLLRALGREEAVAHAAADALGRLGARHYDEVRVLVQSRGLNGPDAPYLCRALGACGRADDSPLLKHALGGDAPAVRRAAAEALAQLPPAGDVDEALTFALADESADVRASAARALGAHRAEPAAEALARCALEGEPLVRASASRALGLVATEHASARGLLRRVADSRDPAAAVPALEALAKLDDRADDARFLGALLSVDGETVKAAARGLGLRAGSSPEEVKRSALAALERALVDARWDVRRQAVLALADYGAMSQLWARRAHEADPLVLSTIESALAGARGER